jgi:hypothetical protein
VLEFGSVARLFRVVILGISYLPRARWVWDTLAIALQTGKPLFETKASSCDGGQKNKFVAYGGLDASISSERVGQRLTEDNCNGAV